MHAGRCDSAEVSLGSTVDVVNDNHIVCRLEQVKYCCGGGTSRSIRRAMLGALCLDCAAESNPRPYSRRRKRNRKSSLSVSTSREKISGPKHNSNCCMLGSCDFLRHPGDSIIGKANGGYLDLHTSPYHLS